MVEPTVGDVAGLAAAGIVDVPTASTTANRAPLRSFMMDLPVAASVWGATHHAVVVPSFDYVRCRMRVGGRGGILGEGTRRARPVFELPRTTAARRVRP
jgi:hypothetical protein